MRGSQNRADENDEQVGITGDLLDDNPIDQVAANLVRADRDARGCLAPDPPNPQACPPRIAVSRSGAALAVHKTPHNGVQPCNLTYFSFGPLFWED